MLHFSSFKCSPYFKKSLSLVWLWLSVLISLSYIWTIWQNYGKSFCTSYRWGVLYYSASLRTEWQNSDKHVIDTAPKKKVKEVKGLVLLHMFSVHWKLNADACCVYIPVSSKGMTKKKFLFFLRFHLTQCHVSTVKQSAVFVVIWLLWPVSAGHQMLEWDLCQNRTAVKYLMHIKLFLICIC